MILSAMASMDVVQMLEQELLALRGKIDGRALEAPLAQVATIMAIRVAAGRARWAIQEMGASPPEVAMLPEEEVQELGAAPGGAQAEGGPARLRIHIGSWRSFC